MKSRRDKITTRSLVAALLCVPLLIHCGSDSDPGGTAGAGGEPGAGHGGMAHGGGGGRAGSSHTDGGRVGDAGESTTGGTDSAGADSGGDAGADSGGRSGSGGDHSSSGGIAGIGGASGSGLGGSGAGLGGSGAGLGGASGAGLGGASGAGLGGASGAGLGGVSGAAVGGNSGGGLGGTSTGGGGTSGTGHLSISTADLAFVFACPGPNTIGAQTVTLTNDGNAAIDWTSSSDSAQLSIAPTGSHLAAGAHIDVAVSRLGLPPPPPFTQTSLGQIHFQSGISGASPLDVDVYQAVFGYYAPPRPNLEYGDVYAGTTPTLQIWADFDLPGEVLSSSNPNFELNGLVPAHPPGQWTLTFKTYPVALGQQTTTLTLGSMWGCVLSPNTFTATANVVYDTSCTHVSEGTPCSPTASCVSGVCTASGG